MVDVVRRFVGVGNDILKDDFQFLIWNFYHGFYKHFFDTRKI